MTIEDIINKKDYDYVEYRLLINQKDIFAGAFASKNGRIISLDGDIYSKDEEVLRYKEWSNSDKGIQNGLTVVVECP